MKVKRFEAAMKLSKSRIAVESERRKGRDSALWPNFHTEGMTFMLVVGADKEIVFDSFGGKTLTVGADGGFGTIEVEKVVIQHGVSCP